MNNSYTSITVKKETQDLIQSIKACIKLKKKENISSDQIITKYLMEGIKVLDPQVATMLELLSEDSPACEEKNLPENEAIVTK